MNTKLIKLAELKDSQKIIITKGELLETAKEQAGDVLGQFINECGKMAEANWCPDHVAMLERLFDKVLHNEPYADKPEEEK